MHGEYIIEDRDKDGGPSSSHAHCNHLQVVQPPLQEGDVTYSIIQYLVISWVRFDSFSVEEGASLHVTDVHGCVHSVLPASHYAI